MRSLASSNDTSFCGCASKAINAVLPPSAIPSSTIFAPWNSRQSSTYFSTSAGCFRNANSPIVEGCV